MAVAIEKRKGDKELQLKVAEAIQDDVNKGIVRIDTTFMQSIGVRAGDIVEIEGEKKSVAITDRAYPGDISLNIIRMDGIVRRNAKAGIGEMVLVRKADVKEAKKVTIAPAKKGIMVRASPEIFKQGLLGRAVVKGDIVALGGTRRRRTTMMENPFFDDVFSFLDESMMGFGFGDIKFIVADTNPKQAVIISEQTEVIFNPEAVEVSDEIAPEVSYEDIGGLDEEIKKVREMVELPLKHPEIFERLGIEPPKGVLLHGPPGTGKTLLAKAVANETNSHFILINGPEIMSKYYGQSLPAYEKVLVREKGLFKRIPIGDIVNKNKQGLEAVCFDKDGRIMLRPVTGLIRHELSSRLMRIRTSSGRSIDVTDDHSVFTLGGQGIESTPTSNLVAGESFIAVPKQIPQNSAPLDQINLMECLKEEDFGIVIRGNKGQVSHAVGKLGIARSAKILGVTEKYVYDLKNSKKCIGIRAAKFIRLMEEASLPVDTGLLQISTKGKSMPALLRLNENLMSFFGLWMAEGSYTDKNEVRLSIHRKEEPFVAELCRNLFGNITLYHKQNSRATDIYICSGILGKVMKHVLGFNSGARNKHVPEFVLNVDKKLLAAFLRGYISGDGSINRKTPAPMVEIDTESRDLADDVAYLLLNFGIVAKIYGRRGRAQKRICFADFENLGRFLEIGFFSGEKNQFISQYINSKKFSRRDQIPLTIGLREFLDSHGNFSAWKNSRSIGANVLQELKDPRLQLLTDSDMHWDRVVSVEEIPAQDRCVYDLSVPGCENFISGFGGIFAHNSEENIRKKFEEATKNAPSIIFIDEIDAIATKRDETRGEVERRVVAQLLANMDGLQSRGKVIVIAATNAPNFLDPALRRPGRFDREIEIGVPSKEGRLKILKIHTRNMPLGENKKLFNEKEREKVLKTASEMTHGFVGADLSALAKEAAMVVLRKVLPEIKLKEDEPIPIELLEQLMINFDDFKEALKVVRPSALREVLIEKPSTKWEDIGGLENVKQELKEAVEWPLKFPDAFTRLGVRPPKGILIYGAPGTGKTMLAKAVANESEANFILVKGPELLSKWVGESEKAVREVFKKARQTAPTIIFFDEIDSLAPRRGNGTDSHVTERVVNQLLTEMDGLEELHDVVVLAASNRPDIIDTALLRPGRFDRMILAPVPEEKVRLEIFRVHTKGMPLAKDIHIEQLAKKSDGYAGADIEAVCREAAIYALRKSDMQAKEVTAKDFDEALKKVPPSITKDVEKAYEELGKHFTAARGKQMKDERPSYMG